MKEESTPMRYEHEHGAALPTLQQQEAQGLPPREQAACCIVGAGPAGAILALLLARQGIPVVLLEAHMDFEREFRGDTLHPSVMEILDEIGLADRLLQLRHTRMHRAVIASRTAPMTIEFSRLRTKFPYITVMAQSRFLAFITEEARRYPTFRLLLGAQVDGLIEEDGVVRGVSYRGQKGRAELRAAVTVGADGRFSRLRRLTTLEPVKTSPPMDILWFRLSRREEDPLDPLGIRPSESEGPGVVFINRFDYWQLGLVIPKDGYQQVHAQGLEHLRRSIAQALPELADRVGELQAWKHIAVLSIESSRLRRWYTPGLLLIGDAAHVMSPVGGVGINYAIADAVVAANVLGAKLKAGAPIETRDLARIQRRREWPTRVIQTFQAAAQRMGETTSGRPGAQNVPVLARFMRLLLRAPGLRRLPARLIGFGLWPAHVRRDERVR
jgi:2-polyprenyl-6-methoxyphenol hydroxylase-like FAD-dependent oxidoreductase